MLPLPLAQVPQPEPQTLWESVQSSLSSADFWFQVVVILVCWPLWFPILRAIYRELDRSLRPEGGVFARQYTERELALLEERDRETSDPEPLKSVPRVDRMAEARRGPRPARKGGAVRPAASGGAPGRKAGSGRAMRPRRGRGF